MSRKVIAYTCTLPAGYSNRNATAAECYRYGGIPVTGVVAAGTLPMVGPLAQAQPAEFAAALAAHHVHAPLVLLYGPLALGAGLGVGQYPVGIFTLCTVLPQPHAHSHAVHLYDGHHTHQPS